MRYFFIILTVLLGTGELSLAQWTTSGANISNTNSGNVGIGTANPTSRLHLNGNFRSEGSFSQGWPGTFDIDANGIVGGRFSLLANGKVGIGIPDPLPYSQLQVHGNGGIASTGPGAEFRLRNQNSTRTSEVYLDEWQWYATDNIARFAKPGIGDIMAITAAGNVGIGTINPGARLQVDGNFRLLGCTDGCTRGNNQDMLKLLR